MSGYIQTNQIVNLLDDDYFFTAQDSGKIFVVPTLTAARTLRMPPLEDGLRFTLINGSPAGLANQALVDAYEVGNNMYGVTMNTGAGNSAALITYNDAMEIIMDATSVKGDYLELYCDGIRWYGTGMSGTVGFA